MKKFNTLNKQLQNLQSQKNKLYSIENLSIFQFIKYKKLISKESKITKQMQKISNLENNINLWYTTSTKNWIEDPKINCRKYCKLEQNATYKRNIKLYKLCLINKKPLSPFIQNKFDFISGNIKPIINEIYTKIQKYNFFKIFYDKYKYFTSYTLPQKLNKLAINSTKKFIKHYRKMYNGIHFFRNYISSKDSIRYISMIKQEATKQLDNCEKATSFRDSIKVKNVDTNKYISIHENKTDINKEFLELSL